MKSISSAFVRAQKEFSPALKTSSNPHFKSKYADLAACVEAVLDALNNNGIALMQLTHETDSGVMVETTFIHESGEVLSGGKLHVPAPKQDPQGYGSALSYARRYSLMAACGIAPEDDDGNAASRPTTKPAGFKTLPTDGAGDGISEDRKIKLEEYAQYITDCKGMGDWVALKACLDEVVENEEKLYLWTKLKSDVRSYIKKHQEEDKANG